MALREVPHKSKNPGPQANNFLPVKILAKKYGCNPKLIYRRIRVGDIKIRRVEGIMQAFVPEADAIFGTPEPIEATKASKSAIKRMAIQAGTSVDLTISTPEAERLEKIWKAKRQEIACKKAEGELIEIADARKRIFELSRRTRDSIRHIPGRIAHELAAEVDPHQVEIFLMREIDRSLEEMCDNVLGGQTDGTNGATKTRKDLKGEFGEVPQELQKPRSQGHASDDRDQS